MTPAWSELWFWLALAAVVFLAQGFVELWLVDRRLPRLAEQPPLSGARAPQVSIIVAARNEADAVEAAVRALVAQDYRPLEIIALDDRSTDQTGPILDRLAEEYPALRIVHVGELPAGWLGKNHALWLGARAAQGQLLLFTDADVIMRPDAVARAVGYLEAAGADHVTVAPQITMHSLWAELALGAFHLLGMLFARPHRCRHERGRFFVGIGAFNLVRRAAYDRAGSHQRIPLRPDDDMRLGQILKRSGARQRLLVGRGALSVEWYSTLRQMIVGLEKNSFAGADYSVWKLGAGTLAVGLLLLAPWINVWHTGGWAQGLNLAAVTLVVLAYAHTIAVWHALPRWHALLFPLGAGLLWFAVWRAVWLTLCRGGIAWRGTHYSLAELRGNPVGP